LNKADFVGSLEGIKICKNAPSFNHLLFADDSLAIDILANDDIEGRDGLMLPTNVIHRCHFLGDDGRWLETR
jgi:hypothetical protein